MRPQAFAEFFYSVFVKLSSFKSLRNLRKAYIFQEFLKVYYRSVLAESFKTFIFQKFRLPLCHKVNLQSCVARYTASRGPSIFLDKSGRGRD